MALGWTNIDEGMKLLDPRRTGVAHIQDQSRLVTTVAGCRTTDCTGKPGGVLLLPWSPGTSNAAIPTLPLPPVKIGPRAGWEHKAPSEVGRKSMPSPRGWCESGRQQRRRKGKKAARATTNQPTVRVRARLLPPSQLPNPRVPTDQEKRSSLVWGRGRTGRSPLCPRANACTARVSRPKPKKAVRHASTICALPGRLGGLPPCWCSTGHRPPGLTP